MQYKLRNIYTLLVICTTFTEGILQCVVMRRCKDTSLRKAGADTIRTHKGPIYYPSSVKESTRTGRKLHLYRIKSRFQPRTTALQQLIITFQPQIITFPDLIVTFQQLETTSRPITQKFMSAQVRAPIG